MTIKNSKQVVDLNLISPKPEDVHFWLQVRAQKSTQENNPIGVLTEEKLRQQISESNSDLCHKKSTHRFYIQMDSQHHVGVIALKDINWESGVCELGYLIAEPFQGRGIASQAVALITAKAFENGIKKVKATTYVNNVASFKVLQKNGFILEGTLKNEVLIQGKLQDMFIWAAFSK